MNTPPPTKEYRLAIRRPVTTAMIFLTLVVFGMKSYQGLAINLMPDISYPTLTVRTEYEGAAPQDVEKLVTRPLEETLSIVSGMEEISSSSAPGVSEIVLEFTWGTDMNLAMQDVRDQLDQYAPPQEVTEKPIILRYDPTLDPVLRIAVTGPGIESFSGTPEQRRIAYEQYLTDIRESAERHVKSDLEGEIGIAQVNVKGGREKEIEIQVDTNRLSNLNLSLGAVNSALAQQNINLSGGSLREGKTEFLVRTLNEYESVSEISETIIARPEGNTIRLRDVADVHMGDKDRDTIVRMNGGEAVELEIFKDGDANTVQVCKKLRDLLGIESEETSWDRFQARARAARGESDEEAEETKRQDELAKTLRSRLPNNVELTVISDQSRFILGSIREVQRTAVVGGLLALLILYAFLRDMRSTAIIGVAIPISVIATFIPMFSRDISLNIMSLGGLALGIGMLVDNSIVVLESIFRCREEGDGVVDAADRGTQEVGSAVTASTMTTIAVFLPIAFVEGVAGQLFKDQALTVTFSLIASLIAALYLIPMIASRQRIAGEGGRGAIWFLSAYREARGEVGSTWASSVGRTIPIAWRNKKKDMADRFQSTMEPVRNAWSQDEKGVTIGHLVSRLFGSIAAPLLLVAFVAQELLVTIASLATVVLFLFVVTMGGIIFVVWRTIKLILWLPLKIFDMSFNALRTGYGVFLRTTLQFGPVIMVLVGLVAWHAFTTASQLGQELIPPLKQGEFGIRMEAPPGTRLEETAAQAEAIERIALDYPEVETVAMQVGQERGKTGGDEGENIATLTVLLENPAETSKYQDRIIEDLRKQIARVTSNEVTFTLPKLFSFKTAVELQVRGDDIHLLRRAGKDILEAVRDVPGLRDAELSVKEGYPEIILEMDRDRLWQYNLTAEQVAQRLRSEVQGDIATRFNEEGFKVDVRVRTDEANMRSISDLRNISVSDTNPPIPLYSVAKLTVAEGPSEIRRLDQQQVVLITGNVEGRDLGAVMAEVMELAAEVPLPEQYEVLPGGQNRELETSYNSQIFALSLAIFLVYVVMACQFESLLHPGLVMFSVPLAFIGVVYALEFMSIPLSVVVFIGGITLAGIVVNNAIVLVDYINQLRARGLVKREAVIEAGKVRLRPILMTTLTTVLGLLPMALYSGEGAEIRQPMAITIIAGLLSSTILTLVIVPTVYDLFGGRDKA